MQPVMEKRAHRAGRSFPGAPCTKSLQTTERITRFVTGKTFDRIARIGATRYLGIGPGWRVMSLEKQSRAGRIGILKSILSLACLAPFPNYSCDYRVHGDI